jgi:hypothetical protein
MKCTTLHVLFFPRSAKRLNILLKEYIMLLGANMRLYIVRLVNCDKSNNIIKQRCM